MISQTGYWTQEEANFGHAYSNTLCDYMSNIFSKNEQLIDFGCGLGTYLSNLHNKGFTKLLGVEGYGLNNFEYDNIVIQDLAVDFDLNVRGNVMSLEVGEHIPKQYENVFIDNITKHCSNLLIISWAVPGQGGLGHFNEQPNEYIIGSIVKRGFQYMAEQTELLRQYPDDFCCPYFRKTLMIFKRSV